MNRDTQSQRPQQLLGFAQQFGNQRTMLDSNKTKDGQRPSDNSGPNPKRRRISDRSDERSPAAQRDGAEAARPTVSADTVPHRHRNPDTSKQPASNASSKAATNHASIASLKTLMDQFAENFESFQLRGRAIKYLKRHPRIQEQNHYRPSDYSSASDLQMSERKAAQEDIYRADKQITEFCNKISPALGSILQGVLESGGIGAAAPPSIPDKQMVSEAKLDAVQDSIKKELETLFKKDLAESQQAMKEVLKSQTSTLKEALSQEYDHKFKSLKETMTQEWEEREASLKKKLAQEGEERVKSLKKLLAQDYEKQIAEMKISVARENRDRVLDLRIALTNESQKNAALEKKMASLESELDEATSGQRQKLESLVDQSHLDQQLQSLSSSQEEKLVAIRSYVNMKTDDTFYFQQLERVELLSSSQKEKLDEFEGRLNQAEDNARKIEDLQGQMCNFPVLIKEKAQQLSDLQGEKFGELEAGLSRLSDESSATRQLLNSQSVKLSKLDGLQDYTSSVDDLKRLEARVDSLADDSPRFRGLLKEGCTHLDLIEEKAQVFNARLASLESVASTLSAKVSDDIRAEMARMSQHIQDLHSQHEPPSLSADSIRQAIWLEVEKEIESKANDTKLMLRNVQSRLARFLKTERLLRETLEAQCAEVTHQLLDAQQEATAAKSQFSELKEKVNEHALNHDKILNCIEEKFNSRVWAVIMDTNRVFDSVFVHLRGLGAWQSNFSTRGLYRDIVNHINASIPDGVVIQLMNLKQRIEVAEARIAAHEDNIGNKRRKLPSGRSQMVNGDQAGA